ncbi:MAG: hypothetical protein ACLVHY_07245 [Gemmiger sp.]
MEIGDFAVKHCHGGGPDGAFVLLAMFAPLVYRRIAEPVENSVHISRSGSASF